MLIQVDAFKTDPVTVAVGYWKKVADGGGYWVIPGVGHRGGVMFWLDCLGDIFEVPGWPGTEQGSAVDNRIHKKKEATS